MARALRAFLRDVLAPEAKLQTEAPPVPLGERQLQPLQQQQPLGDGDIMQERASGQQGDAALD